MVKAKLKSVWLFLLIFALSLILLASCVPRAQVVEGVEEKQEPKPEVGFPPAPAVASLDSQVVELVEKAKKIESYTYLLDEADPKGFTVFVYKNKSKKKYLSPVKREGEIFYNEVYLDDTNKNAVAICRDGGVLCEGLGDKVFTLTYEAERNLVDPLNLVREVVLAEKVGTEKIDNRATLIIKYLNKEGLTEKLWLDEFYGVPMRQVVFAPQQDNEETELLKHTFTKIKIGSVKEADVTVPESFRKS